jgi:hypothetical protein
MLQVTVSTFRRFWVGRCVSDSPKAARWLAAADGRFREKLTWSDAEIGLLFFAVRSEAFGTTPP